MSSGKIDQAVIDALMERIPGTDWFPSTRARHAPMIPVGTSLRL
jgi:hypothetical protein